jgi:hypothetical protein
MFTVTNHEGVPHLLTIMHAWLLAGVAFRFDGTDLHTDNGRALGLVPAHRCGGALLERVEPLGPYAPEAELVYAPRRKSSGTILAQGKGFRPPEKGHV